MPQKKARSEHRMSEGRYVQHSAVKFAKRLLLWRTQQNLSRREVGEKIGCHGQAISNVEECKNFPSWSLYVSLCKLMGVEPVPGMPEEL